MTTWPAGLPSSPILGSLSVAADDNALRFQPDAGPAIRRARYTAISETYSFTIIFSAAEFAAFKQFYKDALGNGVASFDFIDPITGAIKSFSFAEPYSFQSMQVNGYYAVAITLTKAAE